MGEVILAASKSSSSGGSLLFLLIIVALFGLLYFVTIRPQRNRQRRAMQTQREVGPGARVRTTAGMYATVAAVDGDDVILEVAPGVEVRFLRRAIMEVVGEGVAPEPAAFEAAGSDDAESGEPAADGHEPFGAADGQAADTVAEPGGSAQANGAAASEAVPTEKERPAG